jgi:hypothetical protein
MCKSLLTRALFLLLLLPAAAMADASIGDIAENLLGPTSIVTKLVEIACYIIGLAFILVGIAQYKIHRQSPKLVPLTTPILLVVLGFVALGIPYTTQMGKTGRTETVKEATTLPMPDTTNPGGTIPYNPSSKQTPSTPPTDTPVQPQSPPPTDGGSGHWTDDPRYR